MTNTVAISIITTIVTLLAIGVVIVGLRHREDQKWRCTEGKCEVDINGMYNSKSACQEACNGGDLNAWACTSDHQCVKANQGYTSKDLCEKNCSASTVGYDQYPAYYPYYPQSLLWWPRYRGWRRRW